MKRTRKLATALFALAVVVAAVYTTGAFTSTTASRSAEVAVAGDGSAFLSLQPSEGPNGEYASYGADGALEVRLGGADSKASGVNPDSRTVFKNVFTITNNGSQPVSVWLTGGRAAVTFVRSDDTSLEGKDGAVTLRPGGEPVHVGLAIDARGVKPGKDLLESVTIHTDAGVGDGSVSVSAPAQGGSDGRTTVTTIETTASDASDTNGPALPITGGVPGSLGDGRFYSVGRPRDLSKADTSVDLVSVIAQRLVPFGSLGSVFADHKDCSENSTESSESAPSVPEGPTTPATETPETTTTEETPSRHATRPACGDRDDIGSNSRSGNGGNEGGGLGDIVTKGLTVAASLSPLSYIAAVASNKNDSSRGPSDEGGDSSVSNNSSDNSAKVSPRWGRCVPGELMSDENEREWCKASANDIPGTSTNPVVFGAKTAVTIGMDLEKTYGDEVANKTENADEVGWIDGDGDGENDIDELQEVLNIDDDSEEDDDDDGVVGTWP